MEREGLNGDVAFYLDEYLGGLPPRQRDALKKLGALHERYRAAARLSAPLAAESYVVHLVVDSLKFNELMPPAAGERLADVGSGGGYPGLPLAVVREDIHVILIEAAARKAEYLRIAAAELGLANVTVEGRRAEALAGNGFDVAAAKAVTRVDAALKVLLPLVKTGGRAVLFLGDYDAAALGRLEAQARGAGGRPGRTCYYELPGLARPRLVAEIIKNDVSRET